MWEMLHHGRLVGFFVDCPGCQTLKQRNEHFVAIHTFYIEIPDLNWSVRVPTWTWNGDRDRPTFTPSLKMSTTYYFDGETPEDVVCHFYLTDGIFEFQGDSTHGLAGQKVPMDQT